MNPYEIRVILDHWNAELTAQALAAVSRSRLSQKRSELYDMALDRLNKSAQAAALGDYGLAIDNMISAAMHYGKAEGP